MPVCSYCKINYEVPRGLTYVLTNGEIMYFCSSKCQKNWNLGRRADKVNWIRKANKVAVNKEKKE
ncbi:MAG TPA: 50S ribosomal protein L24e [Candidatus Nanoarchaeia archaeon]|nr:50S ribosomal protein L24e [Candidatus Nanoarchaeia archaeon]